MHAQEAECVQMALGICEARIMVNFMEELGFPLSREIPLFEDNEAACKLATEHLNAGRSKHIPHKYHVVKEQVMDVKNFKIHWCQSGWQLADMFTKSLPVKAFEEMDRHIRGWDNRDYERLCPAIEPGES